MKKSVKNLLLGGIFAVLSALFILLLRTVDVAAVGPAGTSVGFSGINREVADRIGVNMTLYDITEWLGYLAIAVAAAFAVVGLIQLIKRKSLFKVDRGILALGVLFVVVIAIYVFFEKVVVNYRPIIMPGADVPEASFPSSHTMLSYVVMGACAGLLEDYVKNKPLRVVLQTACSVIALFTVLARLRSGAHWLTDIIGGLLISASLLFFFAAAKDKKPNKS